jgi:hypothetical protein
MQNTLLLFLFYGDIKFLFVVVNQLLNVDIGLLLLRDFGIACDLLVGVLAARRSFGHALRIVRLLPFGLHYKGLLSVISDCGGWELIKDFDAAVLLLWALGGNDLQRCFAFCLFGSRELVRFFLRVVPHELGIVFGATMGS